MHKALSLTQVHAVLSSFSVSFINTYQPLCYSQRKSTQSEIAILIQVSESPTSLWIPDRLTVNVVSCSTIFRNREGVGAHSSSHWVLGSVLGTQSPLSKDKWGQNCSPFLDPSGVWIWSVDGHKQCLLTLLDTMRPQGGMCCPWNTL